MGPPNKILQNDHVWQVWINLSKIGHVKLEIFPIFA